MYISQEIGGGLFMNLDKRKLIHIIGAVAMVILFVLSASMLMDVLR